MLYLILFIIVAIIAINVKTNLNVGVMAIVASFIIGTLCMGLSPKTIYGMFNLQLFLQMFGIGFFYGFARSNGTLPLLGEKVIYMTRKVPWATLLCVGILTMLVAGAGTGPQTITLFTPLVIPLAKALGVPVVLALVAIMFPCQIGVNFATSSGGVVMGGLINGTPFESAKDAIIARNAINVAILEIVCLAVFYIIFKGYKAKTPDIEKPGPFNRNQRITLCLILGAVLLLAGPSIWQTIFGKSVLMTKIKGYMDSGLVYILFGFLCSVFRLGSQQEALRKTPVGMLLTIGGMGMLIGVAKEAGIMELITSLISENLSGVWIGIALMLAGFLLSFVSSGFSVVLPLLFPLVPGLATTAAQASFYYSSANIGMTLSTISPFSTQGALCLAALETEEERKTMYLSLIILPFATLILAAVLSFIGVIR